jgi:phenylacetate-CoA ligase
MISLFNLTSFLKGYDIRLANKELSSTQSLNDNDFDAWIKRKKWDIVNHHFRNNKCYKNKFKSDLPSNWQDLPIMEKSNYQNKLKNLLSDGCSMSSIYISNTSGSSGHPFFFAKDKFAHSMSWALINDRYKNYDINMASKQARFFGIPLESSSHMKEKAKDFILNRVRFPVFDMSKEIVFNFLEKFKKKKFQYIYGYVNSLVLFSRHLIDMKVTLKEICPSLRYCITTSEMLTPHDKEILIQAFNLPIINEYGVSEVGGLVAIEDLNGNWILNKETQYIEIVDDNGQNLKDGREGVLLITDLYNKAMPFIRYKVGDVGVISKRKKVNGYRVLEKIVGRTNDNIILPSGKTSPGLTFYYISRSILESSGILKEFIVKQISIDTFVFDIVSDKNLSESDINNIKSKMDKYLEPNLNLIINRVKKIDRPSSGKLKHFYSEIAD